MRFNPKGLLFWSSLAAVAACYTFDSTKGLAAFCLLAGLIAVFG